VTINGPSLSVRH